MQPYNYMLNVPNPQQDVMSSVGNMMSLKALAEQRQMNRESHYQDMELAKLRQQGIEMQMANAQAEQARAAQEAEAERIRAEKRNNALVGLRNKKNPSATDFKNILLDFPELNQVITNAYGAMNDEQKKDLKLTSVGVYNALSAGRVDVAKDILNEKLKAAEAAGDEKMVAGLKSTLLNLEADPDAVRTTAPLLSAPLMSDEEFTQAFTRTAEAELKRQEIGLKKQEIIKTRAESNKLINGSPIELTKDGEKLINESVIQATKSASLSDQYMVLSKEIEKSISSAGMIGKGSEAYKKFWGDEDKVTALRQEYTRLRNTAALDMLPPGTASDKDVELAMSAFPDTTASPKLVASFMRGMAKLQKHASMIENEKAEWVSKVGNLSQAPTNIKIQGKIVPAGTRFTDYISKKFGVSPVSEQEGTTATTKPTPTYEQALAKYPNLTRKQYDDWLASRGK